MEAAAELALAPQLDIHSLVQGQANQVERFPDAGIVGCGGGRGHRGVADAREGAPVVGGRMGCVG